MEFNVRVGGGVNKQILSLWVTDTEMAQHCNSFVVSSTAPTSVGFDLGKHVDKSGSTWQGHM